MNNARSQSGGGLGPRGRNLRSCSPEALKQTPNSRIITFSNDGLPSSTRRLLSVSSIPKIPRAMFLRGTLSLLLSSSPVVASMGQETTE